MKGYAAQKLFLGFANQPAQEALLSSLSEELDSTLFERKGRLYLLTHWEVEESTIREIYQRYYKDSRFDVAPSLGCALGEVYATYPRAREAIPLAAVVQGVEVYLVGTEEAEAWLIREGQALEIFAPLKKSIGLGILRCQEGLPLYTLRWRLVTGDVLVLGPRVGEEVLSRKQIQRVVRRGGTPKRVAQALARVLRRRLPQHPMIPLTVIQVGGFRPVPGFGLALEGARSADLEVEPSRGRSPVWVALFVALLAVGLSLWVRRPSLSREKVEGYLLWLLTPRPTKGVQAEYTPTPTPLRSRGTVPPPLLSPMTQTARRSSWVRPTQTLTPTPRYYPLPVLLSPREGESIHSPYLVLEWKWEGTLGENEYFDLRMWRVGTPKRSIAWTKNPRYVERLPSQGWHTWTVVVIRGKDGVIEDELTDEPPPVRFYWEPEDKEHPSGRRRSPTPKPTVAPTRATPPNRPTRVNPR
ncbi:MAG: hypothetical protein J7M05_06105 [Anaerolineae bacterium]|nr:hypothetical protein [Anaerolineae bacterium]